ncbi:hypothetical protein [Beggiatoa leptomitoformis]|uniref:Uncharacterized protein n=1 Tax=Beggiatoa leptomitoformis TaxID=288004 RepID=A0A2N9YGD3_9GAMM|nr:hypothetical protein [Beggiatoa leptomitoformis]ALG68244.1 hypothetical protein AL038_11645 [Beggiatoa leptomitoformis]AUI69449.1 hypothetical protein BLE401_12625 [Beggiatoa leptomitoformis]
MCNQHLADEHNMQEQWIKDDLANRLHKAEEAQKATQQALNAKNEQIKVVDAKLTRLKESRPNPANPLNTVAYYHWHNEKTRVDDRFNALKNEKEELLLTQVLQATVIQHLQNELTYSNDSTKLQQKIAALDTRLTLLKNNAKTVDRELIELKKTEPYWIKNPFSRDWLDKHQQLTATKNTLTIQEQQTINEKNRLEKLKTGGIAQFSPLNTLVNINDVLWNTFKSYQFSIIFLALAIIFGNLLQKGFWYFVIAKFASRAMPIRID